MDVWLFIVDGTSALTYLIHFDGWNLSLSFYFLPQLPSKVWDLQNHLPVLKLHFSWLWNHFQHRLLSPCRCCRNILLPQQRWPLSLQIVSSPSLKLRSFWERCINSDSHRPNSDTDIFIIILYFWLNIFAQIFLLIISNTALMRGLSNLWWISSWCSSWAYS